MQNGSVPRRQQTYRRPDEGADWRGPQTQITLTSEHPAAIWSLHRFKRREDNLDYYYRD